MLSIVIPCYNEEKNVPLLLKRLGVVREKYPDLPFEVILVDNGSADQSPVVFQRELSRPEYAFIKNIRVEKNIGYGFGILSGLKNCQGEVLAWTHADLQTDVGDVLESYKLFIREADIKNTFLKGKRKKRKILESFLSRGMAFISSLALGLKLDDVNAQPKMFHKSFLTRLEKAPYDFSLDLYVLYLAKIKGMKILEYPVDFAKRLYGEAKGGGGASLKTRYKLIKRTWSYIFELRRQIRKGSK